MQNFSDEKIRKIESIYLQKMFLSFKHYLDKNYLYLHIVELIFSGYETKKDEQIHSFMKKIAVYLTAISGLTPNDVVILAKKSDNNLKSEAMSIFDEFIEEGKEIGKEIGKDELRVKAIINLYKRGLNAEMIAEDLEASIGYVKQIITDYLLKQKSKG